MSSWVIVTLTALCAAAIALVWRRTTGGRRIMAAATAGIGVVVTVGALLIRRPSDASSARRSHVPDLATLDKSFRALEDGERETPRDTWDPDYVVDSVGRDPQQLVDWVRDNTYWIPYHGILRGPVGVLMDRQGNSLDRALLLATLLEKAGQTVRLAHAQLNSTEAHDLLPRLLTLRAVAFGASKPVELATPPDVVPVARGYGLDAQRVAARVAARRDTMGRVLSTLNSRVADQTERLLHAVPRADSGAWRTSYDRALGALEDHWWVEMRDGDTWKDLDLVLSSGAHPTPSETIRVADLAGTPFYHEIDVRVVTEQWAGGELSERTVLKHTLRPAELIGQPIVLQFWPMSWVPDSAARPAPLGALRQQVLDERAWAAGLVVGKDLAEVTAILSTGADLDSAPKGGPLAGLGGAISGALGGRSTTAAVGELSAAWIEYEIRVPGEHPKTGRRVVFDLIGPAARANGTAGSLVVNDAKRLERGLALTMRTELLPVNAALSPEFVRHLVASSLLGTRLLAYTARRGAAKLGSAGIDSLIDRSATGVTPLYQLAFARLAWSRDASLEYIDQAGLLTRHVYAVASADTIKQVDATDIVSNDIGVSLLARDAFRVRVAQGVMDTNAESLVRLPGGLWVNTGDAFAASRDWVVHTPNDTSPARWSPMPADVVTRMRGQLASGFVVVAKNWPPRMEITPFPGWWRIDPATGRTLGIGGNGWGEAGFTTRVLTVDPPRTEFAPEPQPTSENMANTTRSRLQAPRFIAAMKRFAAVFTSDYLWCIAANSGQGIRMSIVTSPENCAGDAFAIALLSAVIPLIGYTLEAADFGRPRTPKRPPPPPPPPEGPPTGGNKAGGSSGGSGGGSGAGGGGTGGGGGAGGEGGGAGAGGKGGGKGGGGKGGSGNGGGSAGGNEGGNGGNGGGGGNNPPPPNDPPKPPKPPKNPPPKPPCNSGESIADLEYDYRMRQLEQIDANDAAYKAGGDALQARANGAPQAEVDKLVETWDERLAEATRAADAKEAALKSLNDAIAAQKKAAGDFGQIGQGTPRRQRDPGDIVPDNSCGGTGSAAADAPGKKTIVGGEGEGGEFEP